MSEEKASEAAEAGLQATTPVPELDTALRAALDATRGRQATGASLLPALLRDGREGARAVLLAAAEQGLPELSSLARHYLAWTGDLETVRPLWQAIHGSLERLRVDDTAGVSIQAAAIRYRALRAAEEMAAPLGVDPAPYRQEAEHVLAAARSLWRENEGYFLERQTPEGEEYLPVDAASLLLPVECGIPDQLSALRILDTFERRFWLPDDRVLTTERRPLAARDAQPSSLTTLRAALAFFRVGDPERGWRLLYAVARGVGDAAGDSPEALGLLVQCIIEGLYGLTPDLLAGSVTCAPCFPRDWPGASLRCGDYTLTYERAGTTDRYVLDQPGALPVVLRVPLRFDRLKSVTVNGKPNPYRGETGLERQVVSVRAAAGRKVVLALTYAARTRSRIADPAAWVPTGEPVALTATGGALGRVADPEGALRGVRVSGTRMDARAGAPGRYRFFARLKLPHAEVLHPVSLEVRPDYELLGAMLHVGSTPADAALEVTLRCNKPERLSPPVEFLYAGRTYRARLAARAGTGAPAGAAETFRFPVENPERLVPGGMPMRATVRTLAGPVVLEEETREWGLFRSWPEVLPAFLERCAPLEIPRNERLDVLTARAGEDAEALVGSGVPVTLELPRGGEGDLLMTDAGVPFRAADGDDGFLCLSREGDGSPEAEIAVGRRVQTLYLLLANVTRAAQTHRVQARAHLEYTDGVSESVDLRGPREVDHLLQHYADRALAQALGGCAHADVLDIHPGRREPLARLRLECVAPETWIGVLGVTVVEG